MTNETGAALRGPPHDCSQLAAALSRAGTTMMAKTATISTSAAATLPNQIDEAATGREK